MPQCAVPSLDNLGQVRDSETYDSCSRQSECGLSDSYVVDDFVQKPAADEGKAVCVTLDGMPSTEHVDKIAKLKALLELSWKSDGLFNANEIYKDRRTDSHGTRIFIPNIKLNVDTIAPIRAALLASTFESFALYDILIKDDSKRKSSEFWTDESH